MGLWVATSHSRTVLSLLAEASIVPLGLKATLNTAPLCRSVSPIGLRVATFQSRTVSSLLAEAIVLPSGLKLTLVTSLLWPVSGCPSGRRVATSQSTNVLSLLLAALHKALRLAFLCNVNSHADLFQPFAEVAHTPVTSSPKLPLKGRFQLSQGAPDEALWVCNHGEHG